jgi:hypothetical protein
VDIKNLKNSRVRATSSFCHRQSDVKLCNQGANAKNLQIARENPKKIL